MTAPAGAQTSKGGDLPGRIAIKIDRSGECWEWTGARTAAGYGELSWLGKVCYAHRVVYHLLADPSFPARAGESKIQLDHLCRNRRCVRPDHLEPVTNRENSLRGRDVRITSSRRRGVHWDKRKGAWRAAAQINGKNVKLGYFGSEIAAAEAYLVATGQGVTS